jgi:hypothetical protein
MYMRILKLITKLYMKDNSFGARKPALKFSKICFFNNIFTGTLSKLISQNQRFFSWHGTLNSTASCE